MVTSRRNFLAVLGGVAAALPTAEIPTPANIYEHLRGCWKFYETAEILTGRPSRRSDVVPARNGRYFVFYDAEKEVLRTNGTAFRIWGLCDGTNSPEMIANILSVEYDVSPKACLNDVVMTLLAFKKEGLISLKA